MQIFVANTIKSMVHKIVITTYAELDTFDAYEWYEQERPGLGEEFLFELENTYEKIANHPTYNTYIDDKKELRDLHIYRFPFVVVYRIKNDTVEIISVHHTKKHPDKKYGNKE
jgi:toxin ParE1/3/4